MIAALRALGLPGLLGLLASLALGGLLVSAKLDVRHWHKQSDQFEGLYHAEQAAMDQTELNYRRATDQARAADAANVERVKADQSAINERTSNDFEKRLADARARAAAAERMRSQGAAAAANSGSRGTASVPGVPATASGAAEASGEAGLSGPDRLTATEQAIQLDELIKWVKRQAGVDVNRPPAADPSR